jgi:tRNA threonylcarbamoyladenosine biosynthesis protein TsaE
MLPKQFRIQNLDDLKRLAKLILPYLKPNLFLLLSGNLGVGKTTFVKYMAEELEIEELVSSPTFNILQRYEIKNDYYLNHFDFFRLSNQDNLNDFEELTQFSLNFIEWPENNCKF